MNEEKEGITQPPPMAEGNFHLSSELPGRSRMDVSLYVFHGESQESLSRRIDAAMDAINRQKRIAMIPEIESTLEENKRNLAHNLEAYNVLLERSSGKGKPLSSQEKNHMMVNYPNAIKQYKHNIEKGESDIASIKAKL